MYRGSSFILNYSYKIHEGAVDIILAHRGLYGLEICGVDEQIKENIDLKREFQKYYSKYKYCLLNGKKHNITKAKVSVSETLISKILLGTLACVPAYDEFFVKGLRKAGISPRSFTDKSLKNLIEENLINISELKDYLKGKGYGDYPDMKTLDMFYWELGQDDWGVL